MVGDLVFIFRYQFGVPHDGVQVWEVVIQVDPLEGESPVGPAGQFGALQADQLHYFSIIVALLN